MGKPTVLDDKPNLRLEIDAEGPVLKVRPVGVINEDSNFTSLLEYLRALGAGAKRVQFDMGSITRMNSCGVREWILLMERIPTNVNAEFVNIGELFVEQVNMIPAVLGKKRAPVLTFQAPYRCPSCNTDFPVVLEPKQVQFQGGHPVPPRVACSKCKTELEFESLEEEYFGFLKAA
jgi:hypothetical protein